MLQSKRRRAKSSSSGQATGGGVEGSNDEKESGGPAAAAGLEAESIPRATTGGGQPPACRMEIAVWNGCVFVVCGSVMFRLLPGRKSRVRSSRSRPFEYVSHQSGLPMAPCPQAVGSPASTTRTPVAPRGYMRDGHRRIIAHFGDMGEKSPGDFTVTFGV